MELIEEFRYKKIVEEEIKSHCEFFYNNTMYEEEQFETFKKGLKEVEDHIVDLDKKAKMEELAKYFVTFIHSEKYPNISESQVQKSSQIIAATYLYNNNIFNEAFQGGKVNFSDYIKYFIASCTTKDNAERLIMDEQMRLTKRSMAEMRYYRHNPPDREMY